VEKIPSTNEIFFMDDFNARAGKDEDSQTVGRYGEEEINDNGEILKGICDYNNLRISNTFFEHRDIHTFTWTQKARNLKSIIDYVIIKQHSTLQMEDVRVFRGANCGSDHCLVRAKIFFSLDILSG
jgi:endonuclease/exonuclease/phosphatase family metal-dependent hydrolase